MQTHAKQCNAEGIPGNSVQREQGDWNGNVQQGENKPTCWRWLRSLLLFIPNLLLGVLLAVALSQAGDLRDEVQQVDGGGREHAAHGSDPQLAG